MEVGKNVATVNCTQVTYTFTTKEDNWNKAQEQQKKANAPGTTRAITILG